MRDTSRDLLPAAIMVLVIILVGIFAYPEEDPVEELPKPIHMQLTVPEVEFPDVSYAFEVEANYAKAKIVIDSGTAIFDTIDSLEFETVDMVLTDIGKYYVTNYCPAECGGSWMTSSGATCHRASYENRLTEPTTVAVDLSYWPYGTLFYIPAFDRVFIAEDTGPGVQGKWLDLFYEDYSDVVNFPVGYYQVYTVEYVYGTVPCSYYDCREEIVNKVIGWKLSDEMKGIEPESVQKGPIYEEL